MVQSQVLFQIFELLPAKNYKLVQFKTQDAFNFASYQKLEVALDAVGTEPCSFTMYLALTIYTTLPWSHTTIFAKFPKFPKCMFLGHIQDRRGALLIDMFLLSNKSLP